MQAAVLYGREHVEVQPVAVPAIGPRDLLVRVRAALTCGTDVKVFRRGYHARMIVPPALFGHELAGDVVAVGEQVARFSPGQRVVAANSAPCGLCYYCRRDKENLCEDLLFNNGAYAEFIRIPGRLVEKNTYEIPPHLSYQDAALIEPLACVLHGLDETGLRAGDNMVVIGLGPIGLMFVRLGAVLGARVIAMARRDEQLAQAVLLGATETINLRAHADLPAEIRRRTEGRGADVAIEAVGRPELWQLAVSLLRRGGTVNFFGGCPSDTQVGLDTSLLHYSELTCKASFHHTPGHIRRSLEYVAQGAITAHDFVHHEERLENLTAVLHSLSGNGGHMKTAIIP